MKLVVFDCDGTLVDGQASICEAMESAFATCRLPTPSRTEIRRAVGLSLPQAARRLLPGADRSTHHAIADAYKAAFRAAREAGRVNQPLFEGIAPLIETLHSRGRQLAIATGMSDRGLAHMLDVHGIAGRFASLQTADRHPSKPHPAMLEAALFETATDPADAVMVGDTVFDMQMALAAGVPAIGVAWGYHVPGELLEAGATVVTETPAELERLLLS